MQLAAFDAVRASRRLEFRRTIRGSEKQRVCRLRGRPLTEPQPEPRWALERSFQRSSKKKACLQAQTEYYVKITTAGLKLRWNWNNFLNRKQTSTISASPPVFFRAGVHLGKDPKAFICQSPRNIRITAATTGTKFLKWKRKRRKKNLPQQRN